MLLFYSVIMRSIFSRKAMCQAALFGYFLNPSSTPSALSRASTLSARSFFPAFSMHGSRAVLRRKLRGLGGIERAFPAGIHYKCVPAFKRAPSVGNGIRVNGIQRLARIVKIIAPMQKTDDLVYVKLHAEYAVALRLESS